MSTIIPRDFSLMEQDLIEPERHRRRQCGPFCPCALHAPDDVLSAWDAYCALATCVDRQSVLAVVLDALASGSAPELEMLIDEACTNPHERPEDPRIPIYQAVRLAQEIARLAAQAVHDQVGLLHGHD